MAAATPQSSSTMPITTLRAAIALCEESALKQLEDNLIVRGKANVVASDEALISARNDVWGPARSFYTSCFEREKHGTVLSNQNSRRDLSTMEAKLVLQVEEMAKSGLDRQLSWSKLDAGDFSETEYILRRAELHLAFENLADIAQAHKRNTHQTSITDRSTSVDILTLKRAGGEHSPPAFTLVTGTGEVIFEQQEYDKPSSAKSSSSRRRHKRERSLRDQAQHAAAIIAGPSKISQQPATTTRNAAHASQDTPRMQEFESTTSEQDLQVQNSPESAYEAHLHGPLGNVNALLPNVDRPLVDVNYIQAHELESRLSTSTDIVEGGVVCPEIASTRHATTAPQQYVAPERTPAEVNLLSIVSSLPRVPADHEESQTMVRTQQGITRAATPIAPFITVMQTVSVNPKVAAEIVGERKKKNERKFRSLPTIKVSFTITLKNPSARKPSPKPTIMLTFEDDHQTPAITIMGSDIGQLLPTDTTGDSVLIVTFALPSTTFPGLELAEAKVELPLRSVGHIFSTAFALKRGAKENWPAGAMNWTWQTDELLMESNPTYRRLATTQGQNEGDAEGAASIAIYLWNRAMGLLQLAWSVALVLGALGVFLCVIYGVCL